MPRLTDHVFVRRHHLLKQEWFGNDAHAFTRLSPADQWVLHEYYEPTRQLTVEQLLELRGKVTARSPSLPQRAGRAYHRIAPFLADAPAPVREPVALPRRATKRTTKHSQIRVRPLMRPHIDTNKLMSALMQMAHEQLAREREDRQAKNRPDTDHPDEP